MQHLLQMQIRSTCASMLLIDGCPKQMVMAAALWDSG
jgi:hypothetical protein